MYALSLCFKLEFLKVQFRNTESYDFCGGEPTSALRYESETLQSFRIIPGTELTSITGCVRGLPNQ